MKRTSSDERIRISINHWNRSRSLRERTSFILRTFLNLEINSIEQGINKNLHSSQELIWRPNDVEMVNEVTKGVALTPLQGDSVDRSCGKIPLCTYLDDVVL